jgi:DNA-binding MarR family transcriptional regulator
MMDDAPWFEQIALPALLRHARTTSGKAMRRALEDAGFDDIPANGLYIIGGMALAERQIPLRQLILELGISKQSAGQLVDSLVMRGYLERKADESDRRMLMVGLTERGHAAAEVQNKARASIDTKLADRVGHADVSAARRVLGTLIEIRQEEAETGN